MLKDDLADLCRAFAPWANAVLKRRWRLVTELAQLLARTGLRFEVEENAFMQNRLYAAVVLQHQSRITRSMEQITQDPQSWSRLQQHCSGFWLPDASETMWIVRGDEIEAALHWPRAPLQPVDLAFQECLRATGFAGLVACGTPSLLSVSQLRVLFETLDEVTSGADEVSMEVHPATWRDDYLEIGRFNRFSLGVQTFSEAQLQKWGRSTYSFATVEGIVAAIRGQQALPHVVAVPARPQFQRPIPSQPGVGTPDCFLHRR